MLHKNLSFVLSPPAILLNTAATVRKCTFSFSPGEVMAVLPRAGVLLVIFRLAAGERSARRMAGTSVHSHTWARRGERAPRLRVNVRRGLARRCQSFELARLVRLAVPPGNTEAVEPPVVQAAQPAVDLACASQHIDTSCKMLVLSVRVHKNRRDHDCLGGCTQHCKQPCIEDMTGARYLRAEPALR